MLDELIDMESYCYTDEAIPDLFEFELEYGNAVLKAHYGEKLPYITDINILSEQLKVLAFNGDSNAELFLECYGK